MSQLTAEGQRVVNQLSQNSGFSPDAVTHMLAAVLHGNGSMAQFGHSEFGGGGQWMRGGMVMVGDMFNSNLKGRVDSLCNEIALVLGSQPGLFQTGSFQSQSQSGSGEQHQAAGGAMGQSSLFVPEPKSHWWPAELGTPSATGWQNNLRYAYFAGSRRLAVDSGGDIWVYDTQDHQIGGFSQQQGMGNSILLSSQYGTVNLSSLPVVSRNGRPERDAPGSATSPAGVAMPPSPANSPGSSNDGDIFTALERLADLKNKGVIDEQEFGTKKAELLKRL